MSKLEFELMNKEFHEFPKYVTLKDGTKVVVHSKEEEKEKVETKKEVKKEIKKDTKKESK